MKSIDMIDMTRVRINLGMCKVHNGMKLFMDNHPKIQGHWKVRTEFHQLRISTNGTT